MRINKMDKETLKQLLREGKVKIRLPKDDFACEKGWIGKDDLDGEEIERSELKQLLKEIANEL